MAINIPADLSLVQILRPETAGPISILPFQKLDRHICPIKIHHGTLAPLQPPAHAPAVISPAHYLDIETYADAVHRDNSTECMSTFSNLAPATLPPAPHLSLLILSTTSSFYSWMILNRQDCFEGPLTNSIVSYRDLETQNRPDLRLAYKPKFKAAHAHLSSPARGRSALHVLPEHVQPILNSGGHAPANWTVPTNWQFEILTKQIEQSATTPATRAKFQPLSHINRFDISTATFRSFQRDFDLSTERRLNALSRTAQTSRHTLPAWIQAQYDELNAPRPPPTPWVPFRWGPATDSPNVTDDLPVNAATQPRNDSTWPVGQFIIQLAFPDGEQANQTLLVSGLLPVLALERQLGKLVGCKDRVGYITDRVLPNTIIPCPYLTYMTRVRVQRPPPNITICPRSTQRTKTNFPPQRSKQIRIVRTNPWS